MLWARVMQRPSPEETKARDAKRGSAGADRPRDLFAKTPVKKIPPSESPLEECGDPRDQRERVEGEVPFTRSFMEQLFGALYGDYATLKQEITAEVKELKLEVFELGQRVYTLEQAQDAREEELDCHRRELLTLHDNNQELH
ncbi:hypothetical protein NDU88_005603 [Pleurodeles waltl]|uniref:Uncharacterized protein n=1 Tax=Pleurodeles waltl TaxID=8319 RepID=A0AAV7LSJ4_PLEWA|nr:hypothetical protein NDU88_005603 [Pleurodeles waltl]